ncbi:MAG TPA: hypothetical protein VHT52_10500 [Stellaceae bacterium]|nr:hypothetical protein [Stellaceae bacterium]
MQDNNLNTPQKFDIQLSKGLLHERKLERLLSGGRIEVKAEAVQWRRTGNICIEFRCRGKASGIDAFEGDAWAHVICADDEEPLVTLLFPIKRLRDLVQYCRDKGYYRLNRGDDSASDFAIIPLKLFVHWLMKNGQMPQQGPG